ncbi:MAG: hypothetical protein DRP71_10910 [Verrucomicrobia bacterium]|nr:MAG: hypothetical protein DRP71_10910 [Verrucomicrobiota bacterium]
MTKVIRKNDAGCRGRLFWYHSGIRVVLWIGLLLLLPGIKRADGFDYEPIKDPFRERFVLHLNGLSFHIGGSSNDLNELNYGLGFSYDLGRLSSGSRVLNNAVFTFSADIYRDSFYDLGYAFGVALQNRLIGPIDFGLQVGLIHEDNLVDKSGWYLHPYLFPFLETTFDFPVNCRVILIPPVGDLTEGVVTVQFLVRF